MKTGNFHRRDSSLYDLSKWKVLLPRINLAVDELELMVKGNGWRLPKGKEKRAMDGNSRTMRASWRSRRHRGFPNMHFNLLECLETQKTKEVPLMKIF